MDERERVLVLRRALLRGFAVAVDFFAAARFGAALLRDAAAPVDFARDVVLRAAALRAAGLRALAFLRAGDLRVVLREELVLLAAAGSSAAHLPLITRCAASATASAMIDPNLVALDAMLLAACDAVSAASSPASRILRRAAGLALIAAAAAARPAASISLLIAALANLSTVDLPDEVEDLEELVRVGFLGDFAIAFSPSVAGEDTLTT